MKRDVKNITAKITRILRAAGIVKAGVFGSFAKGTPRAGSDVDLLVEYGGRKSLLDLIALEGKLQAALGRKVDVVTYDSISPLLRERILGEEVRIL